MSLFRFPISPRPVTQRSEPLLSSGDVYDPPAPVRKPRKHLVRLAPLPVSNVVILHPCTCRVPRPSRSVVRYGRERNVETVYCHACGGYVSRSAVPV